ncbi:MAG: hypothetical protein LBB65_06930, partial [Burkholderiales bacterium]|nr:hypothetical protein [Burkholderiales bacterium]
MRALSKRLIAFGFFGLAFFANLAFAQAPSTLYYQTYLNLDGNTATGCTVTVPDFPLGNPQTLLGVDVSVVVTVSNGVLVSAERYECVGGVLADQGPDTAHPHYALGGTFIEYRIPNVAITSQTTVGFAASTSPNFDVPSDVMFESNGQPILLAPLLSSANGTPIPASAPILLLLIALAAGFIAARYLRTPHGRHLALLALFVCFAGLSGAVYSAVQIVLDGSGSSWAGVPALATDPEGDAPYPEIDLLKAYGIFQDNTLYLKLDIKQKPGSGTQPLEPVSDFRLLSATVTEPDTQSKVTASGTANQIRGIAAKVRVQNTRTGETVVATLAANVWQSQLTAQPKDVLELTPIAADNTEGGSIRLIVQGTVAEPTLPPDPINDGIAPKLDPLAPYTVYDSTRFLYTGNPPVQTGVDPDTIKPKFASLLVGKTLDRNDQPLSGVTVKVKDHDQYGQTLTRADGQWDIVVNGGQWFTVEYTKDGYLPIQRKVQVAWQDYGYLPDVVLIPLDEHVSVIDLRETSPDAPAFQIHQGTTTSDADGERQATILFPKGVTAQMQMADGTTQPISVLNVRATEYTIGPNGPKAMPGELPPATAYTYAVELSVDQAMEAGAKHVVFSQPLPVYVDNFLNFPVGEIVPQGWYDYDLKAWVPDENGYVLKVLAINNGIAVLDVKGQGNAATAAELAALGITDEEQKVIAQLYPVGKTFWRMRASHFSPGDYNYPVYIPPCSREEACDPPEDDNEDEDPQPDPDNDHCVEGCIIRVENRSMAEDVGVAGTPFSVHYESRRFKRVYKNTTIRLLRDNRPLPATLVRISSNVNLLGRSIPISKEKQANQVAPGDTSAYSWDGKDRYGRAVKGTFVAQHNVSYWHNWAYSQPSSDAKSGFGQYGGRVFIELEENGYVRQQFENRSTAIHYFSSPVGTADSIFLETANLGRWTLNVHHQYDPITRTLSMGNGMDRTTQSFTPQIKSLRAGNNILDVEPLPDGGALYLSSYNSERRYLIERVSEDGTGAETLLEVAADDDFGSPSLIRYDAFRRGIYIATNSAIYYRYPNAQIEWIAGRKKTSPNTLSGDDVFDPQQLQFGSINDMTIGQDGSLYIVDTSARCVRKIDASRQVATIAGGCGSGKGNIPILEGDLATSGGSWAPYSIAMDASGQLFVGAYKYHVAVGTSCSLQKIDMAGRMFTVAGNADVPGCSDENNETNPEWVKFSYPRAVAAGYHNDVYFSTGSFVRRLANNRLSLLLGDSEKLGSEQPSGEPVDGQFNVLNILISATPMKVDAGGNIYFRSYYGYIFMLKEGLPGFSGEEFLIPSSDGKQLYHFDANGRHLETLDALTGAVIYRFGYCPDGLQTVTDHDGNETKIERNGDQ